MNDLPEPDLHPSHKLVSGGWLGVLWAFTFLAGLAAAAQVYHLATDQSPWDPLGEYPIQNVQNRVPGIHAPALFLGDEVRVVGTKCNDTEEPVQVAGTSSVRALEPITAVLVSVGEGTRPPGCQKQTFANDLPARFQRIVAARLEAGELFVRAELTGIETPIREGSDGVPVPWRSETFLIYPAPSGTLGS